MHILLEKYFEQIWGILNFISRVIGVKNTIKISSFLGTISSYLFERERQIALAQLRIPKVKRLVGDNSEQLVRQNFSHVGQSIGELLTIDSYFKEMKSGKIANSVQAINYPGFEQTMEIIKNGGVALSGHIGCIELLAAYHVQRGIPLYVVARSPNFASATTVLDKLRKRYGIIVAWRDDPVSLRVLSKAIKSKALVAALIDQDTALESKYSNFFGIDAAYPIAPIKLALRYNLPIMSSFIYRVRRHKHNIVTQQILYDSNNDNAVQNILDVFNQRLENLISAYPDQWIWWHRRWRRQADIKELPSTKDYIQWLSQVNNL
jgi:KDO2-lipid IV(A) lauroyltransferase